MTDDLVTQTLKTYFFQKGKNLKIIQRYLRIKYKLIMDEKILKKRVQNLTMN